MSNDQITITINDTTHQFKADDVDAMRDLPWTERKQLIDLLENIKQAEYVKTVESRASSNDAGFDSSSNSTPQNFSKSVTNQTNQPSIQSHIDPVKLDPEIKASEKDADDLMTRFILEQKQQHKPVPDKSSVIKLLLIVFAIIIVLAVVF